MHNYFYLSHSKIGNIYVMYIHLPGRHYDINLFQPKAFVSGLTKPSKFVHILGCFYTICSCYFDFTRLFILFRVTLEQVVSGLPARFSFCQLIFLGRFKCFPRQSFRYCYQFWVLFLAERNLTCLQPLPNALYTNCYGLKYCSLNTEAKQIALQFGSLYCPFKVKGLSSCFVLNLRMPGESCLIFN